MILKLLCGKRRRRSLFTSRVCVRMGQKVPKPRTLEQVQEHGEDWIEWGGAIVATVPLLPPEGRSLRVQITLDERLLSKIDAVCKNRSAFLSDAARRLLDERSAVKHRTP
jgi:hypothetical protein